METPDSKRGANLAMLQTVLKTGVDFLLILDEKQYFFAVPDDFMAPGYSKAIARPMAINVCQSKIIKNQYKSIDQLHEDVLLMMKNCFHYNGVTSPFSRAVMALGAKWSLYFLLLRAKFPFLSQRKTSLAIAESKSSRIGEKRKLEETAVTAMPNSSQSKRSKSSSALLIDDVIR